MIDNLFSHPAEAEHERATHDESAESAEPTAMPVFSHPDK